MEKIETDMVNTSSILTLHQTLDKASQIRVVWAKEFASAKAAVAEKILTLGKLNRSMDDLDASGDGSLGSG